MYHTAILIAELSWTFETPMIGGPFDLRAALIVCAVTTVAAALIISAAIMMPAIVISVAPGTTMGAAMLHACIEIGVIALATGVIAGGAAGRYQGLKGEREQEEERIRRLEEIREVDHFLDVYFLPAPDDPDNARDFACVLVSYDATTPQAPVVKTEIEMQTAETFYEAVHTEVELWLRRPIKTDGGQRRRHVAIFLRPYPGDGVYERIRQLCEQRAEIDISRVDGRWESRLKDAAASDEEAGAP